MPAASPPPPTPSSEEEGTDPGGFPDPVFTPALKLRFLDELSRHGNVRVACARVGVSRSGAYLARRRDAGFAGGWRSALCLARSHAEAVLAERALDGVEEPVFFRGELIATRRRYDSRLLLAHLARLDALCREEDAALGLDDPDELALGFDRDLALIADLPEGEALAAAASREEAYDQALEQAEARRLSLGRCRKEAEAAAARWDSAAAALHVAVDRALAGIEFKGRAGLVRPPGRSGSCPLDTVHSVQRGRDLAASPSLTCLTGRL